MTLQGAEGRIWCSKIGWQTVPCLWSIDGEAALTGSSPGMRDQRDLVHRPYNSVHSDSDWLEIKHSADISVDCVLLPEASPD